MPFSRSLPLHGSGVFLHVTDGWVVRTWNLSGVTHSLDLKRTVFSEPVFLHAHKSRLLLTIIFELLLHWVTDDWLCLWVCTHACPSVLAKVQEQRGAAGSVLPLCRPWDQNSGYQVRQQVSRFASPTTHFWRVFFPLIFCSFMFANLLLRLFVILV